MSRRTRTLLWPVTALALFILSIAPLLPVRHGEAATPAGGTLSDISGALTWQGSTYTASVVADPSLCDTALACDHFALTVAVDPSYWATHAGGARVRIQWTSLPNDFDLYAYQNGVAVAHSGRGATDYAPGQTPFEELVIPAASGAYDLTVVPYSVVGSSYTGTVTFDQQSLSSGVAPIFDTTASVTFGPAAIVSAHFLGAEPQTTIERHVPGSPANAVDADRVFVDWPLSSRTAIGQLSRSLDGGESFRLLVDPGCPARSRPNCATAGGGDTENEVNLVSGTVLFADQEQVANEALVSSADHGDTFPLTRQEALSNLASAVDRQWLTWVKPGTVAVAGQDIQGLLAYHVPAAGQYIQGITADGIAVPQPVPQVLLVSQSGPLRVDNTDGPGRGWIYQSFRDGAGFEVATAYAPEYQDPGAWQVNHVADDRPAIFPWINLDSHGNAYAVWVADGVVYYSFSNVDDPANNPQVLTGGQPGRPGTTWSPKQRISLPDVGSAVFPAVVAGDAGRIAIVYDGTTAYTGQSDNAPLATPWNTYLAVVTNALGAGGTSPVISTGVVNHRPIHYGSICTSGTTCTGDRTLLDMIDVGVFEDGRVGVVFTDNNNAIGMPKGRDEDARSGPFVHFASQVAGPSLSAAAPLVTTNRAKGKPVKNGVADPEGDATWPNTAQGTNLPAFDLTGATLSVEKQQVVATLTLKEASAAGARRDLAAYNAAWPLQPAARVQHVVRFSTASDVYHLSMETLADGTRRFFGGKLDANDVLTNGTSALGAGYHTDPSFPVVGEVKGNTVTLRAPLAALGGGDVLQFYSVTGFATAGPLEPDERLILNTMRTVDATAPFDVKLSGREAPSPTPVPTTTPKPTETPILSTAARQAQDAAKPAAELAGQSPAGAVAAPAVTAAAAVTDAAAARGDETATAGQAAAGAAAGAISGGDPAEAVGAVTGSAADAVTGGNLPKPVPSAVGGIVAPD